MCLWAPRVLWAPLPNTRGAQLSLSLNVGPPLSSVIILTKGRIRNMVSTKYFSRENFISFFAIDEATVLEWPKSKAMSVTTLSLLWDPSMIQISDQSGFSTVCCLQSIRLRNRLINFSCCWVVCLVTNPRVSDAAHVGNSLDFSLWLTMWERHYYCCRYWWYFHFIFHEENL